MIIVTPHLTGKELAELCKVSLRTVESWRQRGKGPKYIKLENGLVRYPAAESLAFAGQYQKDSSFAFNLPEEQ